MIPASVLIVTFDGLRRDRVLPELMPNLHAFMAEGTNFLNSRSIFPSETRVAISSLVTGSPPSAHGLVGNAFMHRAVLPDETFNTAKQAHLRAANDAGLLLERPSLGQRLADAGRRLAVVSTATPGASWMMHSDAGRIGHTMFATHANSSVPASHAEAIAAKLGPVPAEAIPDTARIDYAARALTEFVYPGLRPDVGIIWFCDPDKTTHRHGWLSETAFKVQRDTDAAFGRILDWWRQGGDDRPENIIVMSDHGQIIAEEQAGLKGGHNAEFGGTLVEGYVSSLYLDDPSPENIAATARRLMAEPWCGVVFTNGGNGIEGTVPGTFDLAAVHGDHERAGDLVFSLAAHGPEGDDSLGGCVYAGGNPLGGGIHGGLQPGEVTTVLSAVGPAFKRGFASDIRCWLPDIAPTILHILGVPATGMVGRPLVEGLADSTEAPPTLTHRRLEVAAGDRRQVLEQWVRDGVAITDRGWVSGAPSR